MAVPNEGTTALPSDAGSNFFWGLWDGSNFYAPRADNSTAKNLRVAWYDATGAALGTQTNPIGVRLTNGTSWLLGQSAMAASVPVVIASDQTAVSVAQSSTSSSGTLGALDAAVTVALNGASGVSLTLSAGTLIGTIVPEFSNDGGTTWTLGFFDDPTTTLITQAITYATSNTATVQTLLANGGATHMRVRCSVYGSGSTTATLYATNAADNPAEFYTAPKGKPSPQLTVQMGGVGPDGTIQPLQLSNRNDGALAVAVDVGSLLSEVKAMREAIEALVEILSEE